MALLGERASGLFRFRAKDARTFPQPSSETTHPIFSEGFLAQQAVQQAIDSRYAALVPSGPLQALGAGQDHLVSLMPTDAGEYVVKRLQPASRPNLVFGLGIPPHEIPPDTDTTGARERLLEGHGAENIDPHAVAEKINLLHTMATTYLDQGDRLIWPTATLIVDGQVESRQKYLPQGVATPSINRDPREASIQANAKAGLFRTLHERWKRMVLTPDFKQLPPDVQDYWMTYPPDSHYGQNAIFLGLGHVVAIDY